jgi:Cu+-exporting ATPase
MKKTELSIGGMHCSACSTSLQNALSKLDGLENVIVDISTNKASFELDESKISIDKIVEAVDDCGFDVIDAN